MGFGYVRAGFDVLQGLLWLDLMLVSGVWLPGVIQGLFWLPAVQVCCLPAVPILTLHIKKAFLNLS